MEDDKTVVSGQMTGPKNGSGRPEPVPDVEVIHDAIPNLCRELSATQTSTELSNEILALSAEALGVLASAASTAIETQLCSTAGDRHSTHEHRGVLEDNSNQGPYAEISSAERAMEDGYPTVVHERDSAASHRPAKRMRQSTTSMCPLPELEPDSATPPSPQGIFVLAHDMTDPSADNLIHPTIQSGCRFPPVSNAPSNSETETPSCLTCGMTESIPLQKRQAQSI